MFWIRRTLPSLGCVLLVQAGFAAALWFGQSRLAPPAAPRPAQALPLLVWNGPAVASS